MESRERSAARWTRYRRALAGRALPLAFVDLDAFERNAERLLAPARAASKPVRLATKSLRCPALVERAIDCARGAVSGLMTYSAAESAWWAGASPARRGPAARDLLLAYPTVQASDLDHLVAANRDARCAVVVDDPVQVDAIAAAARAAGITVPLVVEQDVSWRPLGSALHVGTRRSPLHDAQGVLALARRIASTAGVRFAGLMAYEAHIAGLTDDDPGSAWRNAARRGMKRLSRGAVERARAGAVHALARAGLAPALVNGGGTGSIAWAATEAALTELTFGSGLLDSYLFDRYVDLALEPAAWFALQVVRRPAPGLVTCHGGGYVASGGGGRDRLPLPALPEGCRLLAMEGAGEVQTPVALPAGVDVAPGDPLFFRHAKAGELAEHFDRYLLVRGDAVVDAAPTYRGLGLCFLG